MWVPSSRPIYIAGHTVCTTACSGHWSPHATRLAACDIRQHIQLCHSSRHTEEPVASWPHTEIVPWGIGTDMTLLRLHLQQWPDATRHSCHRYSNSSLASDQISLTHTRQSVPVRQDLDVQLHETPRCLAADETTHRRVNEQSQRVHPHHERSCPVHHVSQLLAALSQCC